MTDSLGIYRVEGGRPTVSFTRHLPVTPTDLWEAITSPDRLGQWLAPASVDLKVDGMVELVFEPDDPDQIVTGRILTCRPPAELEYEWHWPGERQSVVRFQLDAEGEGTRLVVTHRLLPVEAASGYGAGWHAHLDRLAGSFGSDGTRPDWLARFREVKPQYDRALASLR